MHLLIVKHGALGDVVRTSYFAKPLKDRIGAGLRLSWMTSPAAEPLLRFNPAIDDVWTNFDEAAAFDYDQVYSLDDETAVLEGVAGLRTRRLTGAHLDAQRKPTYTGDSAPWFDMGLLSRLGRTRADELKKLNRRGHAEIFSQIFGVPGPCARFRGDPAAEDWARHWIGGGRPAVGLHPFAGGRWPSKHLPPEALDHLVAALLGGRTPLGRGCQIVLLGTGADRRQNDALAGRFASERLRVANTDDSPLRLAALVKFLDYLITSDSLPMHLALSQDVRTLAFFAPTSAAEIDDLGLLVKVTSNAADYCSYRPDADNRSITAERLIAAMQEWAVAA